MQIQIKCILVAVLFVQINLTSCNIVSSEQDAPEDHWVVQTGSGPVEGTSKDILGEAEVYVFFGIPYAEPPTGNLRFKPPQPVKPWAGVLRANKQPLACYQNKRMASIFRTKYEEERINRPWTEDCLTLNVWVPKPKVKDAPVLVVFHPGAFQFGSNNYPDGGILASVSNDVIVSMNYRLGAFGFLNLGLPDVPGNMGLLDQQLALKWIHENVHHFGGLTKAVILFGAGNAGAASVGYHLLAPDSSDLFATVAPFSGAPLCPWAYQERKVSLKNSRKFSERVGCSTGDEEEVITCLQNVHPEDIVDEHDFGQEDVFADLLPTVDGTFLVESPIDALKLGHFKKTTSLSVSNLHEGSLALAALNADMMPKLEKGLSLENFRKAVLRISPDLSDAALSAVEDFYIDKCQGNDRHKITDAAVNLYSDVLINCCMNQFDEHFVENGGAAFRAVEDIRKVSNPAWVGSWHATSMEFCFGYPIVDEGYSKTENNFSYGAMEWIRDQTRKKASELIKDVPSFDAKDKNYIFWDMDGPVQQSHFREEQCKLWTDIIPKLQQRSKKISGHE